MDENNKKLECIEKRINLMMILHIITTGFIILIYSNAIFALYTSNPMHPYIHFLGIYIFSFFTGFEGIGLISIFLIYNSFYTDFIVTDKKEYDSSQIDKKIKKYNRNLGISLVMVFAVYLLLIFTLIGTNFLTLYFV